MRFAATLDPQGKLEIGPIEPGDLETRRAKLLAVARALGSIVVETSCTSEADLDALAERLAEYLLRTGGR